MTSAELHEAAAGTVDAHRDLLLTLSHDLHADPELSFQETRAAERLAALFEDNGFAVTREAYGLPTAFEAKVGSGEFNIVLCAEYDALPVIGHACGHNVIATITTGAALALAPLADRLGATVTVLGTPAEEHGGGKVELLRAGAYEDATVSAMVHPMNGVDDVSCGDTTMQCVDRFDVVFHGRAAHAAAAPEHGVNAASAATVAQVAIALLRQHVPDGMRLSAVTTSSGEVTNIVPAEARISAEVRSADLDQMLDIKRKMMACFEGAAIATGCSWEQQRSEPRYLSIDQDPAMATAWDANLAAEGRSIVRRPGGGGGSTDMGNVSRLVPSIHPGLVIPGADGPPHTIEFAAAAATPSADEAALLGARVLSRTLIDVATDEAARADLLRRAADRAPGATTVDQDGD